MSQPPFYLDWTFWSFVTAAVAIVLSQLPPISQLMSKLKLNFDVYGKLGVAQELSYPNVRALMGIRNTGAKPVRIESISAELFHEGKAIASLSGLFFWPAPDAKQSMFFTPLILQPGDEWIRNVDFMESLSQQADKSLAQLRADAREYLYTKTNARSMQFVPPHSQVEVTSELQTRINRLLEKQFVWAVGEFEVVFCLRADGVMNTTKRYRFTLHESDVKQMQDEMGRFKYGVGVAFPDQSKQMVFVQPIPLS